MRAFLTPYFEKVRGEIERHGGRVEKFIGDAVLGLFGAPVAHGDDAERAVRAALAIRDELQRMNQADHELDLQARLAVNTGEVIVDLDARPEQGESMVLGDVVNTASRLQAAAPLNGVLVGKETHAATRGAIAYAAAAAGAGERKGGADRGLARPARRGAGGRACALGCSARRARAGARARSRDSGSRCATTAVLTW